MLEQERGRRHLRAPLALGERDLADVERPAHQAHAAGAATAFSSPKIAIASRRTDACNSKRPSASPPTAPSVEVTLLMASLDQRTPAKLPAIAAVRKFKFLLNIMQQTSYRNTLKLLN